MDGVNSFKFTENIQASFKPASAVKPSNSIARGDELNEDTRKRVEQLSSPDERMQDKALINHFKQAITGILITEGKEDLSEAYGLASASQAHASGYEKTLQRAGFNEYHGDLFITNDFKPSREPSYSETYSMNFKIEKATRENESDKLLLKIDSMTRAIEDDKKTGEKGSVTEFPFDSNPALELRGSRDKTNPNLTDHLINILLSSDSDPDGGIPVKEPAAKILDFGQRFKPTQGNSSRRAA